MRSWEYNRFGVLMGASSLASCPRWPSLRGYSWPMITLFSLQGDFCATASLHSLQSCKPGARVLDKYSAYPTAPRVRGWVSGCPTPRGALQGRSHTPGARRPSWHVEPTHRARLWRFLAHLNRAISVLPV